MFPKHLPLAVMALLLAAGQRGATVGAQPVLSAEAPPGPPSGLSASDCSTGGVVVSWNASAGATMYEVWRWGRDFGAPTLIGETSQTSFLDTTSPTCMTMVYWVKSRNEAGTSEPSASDEGQITAGAVTAVWASDGTYTDKVHIVFLDYNAPMPHEIWRSATNDPTSAIRIGGCSTEDTFDDTSAVPGMRYFYWVRAACPGNGCLSSFGGSGSGYANFCLFATLNGVNQTCRTNGVVTNCRLSGLCTVENRGVTVVPPVHFRFFLSADATYDAGTDVLLDEATSKAIKVGKSAKLKFKAKAIGNRSSQFILVVDDGDSVRASAQVP